MLGAYRLWVPQEQLGSPAFVQSMLQVAVAAPAQYSALMNESGEHCLSLLRGCHPIDGIDNLLMMTSALLCLLITVGLTSLFVAMSSAYCVHNPQPQSNTVIAGCSCRTPEETSIAQHAAHPCTAPTMHPLFAPSRECYLIEGLHGSVDHLVPLHAMCTMLWWVQPTRQIW